MFRLICLIIGYLIGCIQTAYFTGKIVANIDIREHGSGNAGTTNTFRVIGRSAGFLVFTLDVIKAIAAYLLCSFIFKSSSSFFTGEQYGFLPGLYAGLGVVLGHNFPFFMKFKGGKGAASSLGVIFCVHLPSALIIYVAGISVILITKYVSAGSLVMLLLFPILLGLFGFGPEVSAIAFALTALSYFTHRGNIKRIIDGSERKVSLKKQVSFKTSGLLQPPF